MSFKQSIVFHALTLVFAFVVAYVGFNAGWRSGWDDGYNCCIDENWQDFDCPQIEFDPFEPVSDPFIAIEDF